MTRLNYITAIVASLLLIISAGCSSSRKSTTQQPRPTALEARYAALDSATHSWTDLNVPFTFSLNKPTDFTITGRMRMIRGRGVDLSLRLLGIEMARIMVTTDSVFASYRLKKQYVAQPLDGVGGNVSGLLANLQDIFMGRVFLVGHTAGNAKGSLPPFSTFEAEETSGLMALSSTVKGTGIRYAFFIDTDNRLTSTEVLYTPAQQATIRYSNFHDTQAGMMPRHENIAVTAGNIIVDADIDWRWSSAKWDTGITLEWVNPRGYRQVTIDQLLGELIKK